MRNAAVLSRMTAFMEFIQFAHLISVEIFRTNERGMNCDGINNSLDVHKQLLLC